LEEWRTEFLHDKNATLKKDGSDRLEKTVKNNWASESIRL
jgi:hypothetical protein